MVAGVRDLCGPSSCPCTVPTGLPPPRGGGSRGKAGLNPGQTTVALAPSNYSIAQCHAWPGLQCCCGAAGSPLISTQPQGCSQGKVLVPTALLPSPRAQDPQDGPWHDHLLARGACAQKGAAAPRGASTQHQAMAADPRWAVRRRDAVWVALRGCCQHLPRCQPRFPTHHQHQGLLVQGLLSHGTWGHHCPVRETQLGGSRDEHCSAGVAPSRGTWQLFEEACATAAVLFTGANLVTTE